TVRDLTRRQQQLAKINRLAVHEAVAAGDLFAAARQITEEATDLLGVEGASIWQRSGEPGKLRCLAKFDRSRRAHSSDSTVQLETSSSAYETLSSGLPIIEHDLAEPQGGEAPRAAGEVTSRLRVPIRVSGELVGLARFDHVGPPRIWQADEINFACEAAFLVVQTISRRDRRLMDVLQAKNAELEARSTELESFTYAVSHDLKSPLFTIKGFLGALERDIAEGNQERIARDIGRIHSAAGTMQLLLDELLELTQIGRVEIAPVAVPLSDLAHEAIELLSRQISERGVHINIAADLPIAYGDRLRLLQMLQNLIENAVKFMGDQVDPQIEIARRDEGSETVCVVRDNGQGIAPRYCEKIFGLFERLDADSPGTGIGLAIVARIVNLHDGRIWAESEGPGRGSSFCFALPWKS
ncbi:MAG: ATP-binding protein, partial [Acidobacteriota bacterium]